MSGHDHVADDSEWVETSYVRELDEAMAFVDEVDGELVVGGPTGTGKTVSDKRAMLATGRPILEAHQAHQERGYDTMRMIYRAVHSLPLDERVPFQDSDRLLGHLVLAFAGLRVILRIQEAQFIGVASSQQLCRLYDAPTSKFVLVLEANNPSAMLGRAPALRSRITRWVDFGPLRDAALYESLGQHHRVLRLTPNPIIDRIDLALCHGRWRDWKNVLATVQRWGLATAPITDELAGALISEIRPREHDACAACARRDARRKK